MMDALECRLVAIENREQLAAVNVLRQTDSFRFVPLRGAPEPPAALPDPQTVFRVVFALELPRVINERVSMLFAREWRLAARGDRIDEPGLIYCFHVVGDPANVLKIGRTSRRPEQRRSEWERELAPGGGKSVRLLFAHETACNEFAEAVVHETLRCARIANRINPRTRKELTEFFRIGNVMAASVFVRETLRYVDSFCRQANERFGTKPRRPARLPPPFPSRSQPRPR